MSAIRITLVGAAGRMGRALAKGLVEKRVPGLVLSGAVDLAHSQGQGTDMGLLAGTSSSGVRLTHDLPALVDATDVFIDFSFHSGIAERAERMAEWGKGWVIGTTGLAPSDQAAVAAAAERIAVVQSPNMSLGVNLLQALVRQAAASLKDRGYDVEVIEAHHRRKLDAPSGTALFLGGAAAEGYGWALPEVQKDGRTGIASSERPVREIGFHAVRGGDVVGHHQVQFLAEGEMIELSHRASSRDTFATGALQAAAWLHGREPGTYSMAHVLGLA
jgi:4-hydroxy-tetrahydrodipicolinate reductase